MAPVAHVTRTMRCVRRGGTDCCSTGTTPWCTTTTHTYYYPPPPAPPPLSDYVFKLVLIGDSHVGKSCLLRRFTRDVFHDDSGGMHFEKHTIELDGTTVKLHIVRPRGARVGDPC